MFRSGQKRTGVDIEGFSVMWRGGRALDGGGVSRGTESGGGMLAMKLKQMEWVRIGRERVRVKGMGIGAFRKGV